MKKRAEYVLLSVAILVSFGIRPAFAIQVFLDESTFQAAATSSLVFESFESLPVSLNQSSFSTTDFVVSALGGGTRLSIRDTPNQAAHATDGEKFLMWSPQYTDPSAIFSFSLASSVFGITITDALDGVADGSLSLSTNSGEVLTDFLSGILPNGNEYFVGVITDVPFTELVITRSFGAGDSQDAIGLDGVFFERIPEPNTIHLLAIGLILSVGLKFLHPYVPRVI